ncbi:MAG TPA: ATP-binding protein [Saprospiraceae bacterium]|nr:ATP-binding protein [Saprospiraceae bacterium]
MINESDDAKRLRAIIDTVIDGVIIINSKGIIERLNPAAAALFEYEATELIGRNIKLLMPDPYQSQHDQYIENYHKTRVPHIIGVGREVQGMKKSGDTFPCRLAVSETRLDNRTIFTGIIHDLSDYKNAQAEIEKLNKELETRVIARTYELERVVNQLLKTNKSLKQQIAQRQKVEAELKEREEELQISLEKEKELGELKSRFVSMASHEFRTPLATVLSSAALLSRYKESEQQEKRDRHIQRIKNSVNHLTAILNDFLSLGRLEEGKLQIQAEYMDPADICRSTIEELQGLLKEGQDIQFAVKGQTCKTLLDKKVLKNILFNLLSNAIKYSDKAVALGLEFNEYSFELRVKDFGMGIPESDQKHLFTRFFRASNVTNIQGTGLGLNIVKRYVELLDGSIDFQSEVDHGTEFLITIPYENKLKAHEKNPDH